MEARLARLEERTEHIQRDVSATKVDMRRLDAKIDAVRDKIDVVRDKIDAVKDSVVALADRIGSFEAKISAVETSIIKWIVGAIIAVAALAFTIAKFVS